MWTWTRRCLTWSWVGMFMISGEYKINMSGKVHINDALMWGYEQGGLYVLCSYLRATTSGKVRSWIDHACWTTGGEVRRVGLRAGRFVEVGPWTDKFMETLYILDPWLGKWISIFICIMRQWYEILGYRVLRLSNLDEIK